MSAYRLVCIAELAHQLQLSPARLRLQQILATDYLLTLIEPDQYYPYSWVCWHITGYRAPIGQVDAASLRGASLAPDLLQLCLDLTHHDPIPQTALAWPVWTPAELAERLGVSTKTISRWRADGLPAWYTSDPAGQVRLTIPEAGLRRFIVAHLDAVMRSRRFSQLSETQRDEVIERARQLRAGGATSMNRICKMISAEIGRSAETIRYTLLRHDPALGRLHAPAADLSPDEHAIIFGCWRNGDSLEALAERFGRTVRTIRKIVLAQQRRQLLGRKVQFIYSAEFDLPDAESRILGESQPWAAAPCEGLPPVREEPDPAALLASDLVVTGTQDPLSAEEETATFRRYNYCKFRLAGLQQQLRRSASVELVERATAWAAKVDALRSRLIETNLRLTVSVASRHMRYGASLEEMASEGNLVLLRAIEKFDYTRGFKFSTYATWAIMKLYARLVPLWESRRRHQVTGCEEILKTASAPEQAAAAMDQQMVGGLVQQLLGSLSRRERKIIQWHYGMPEGTPARSLTEIARKFGVSKERIRQIEARGLSKLKAMLDERQFQYT